MSRPAWVRREPPLDPTVAVGVGRVAAKLVERLLTDSDESLSALEGVASPSLVAVRGLVDRLPWVDGIQYFGEDPEAPGVFLPTTRRPCPRSAGPLPVLSTALRRRAPPGPLVWLADGRVVPLASARRLDRATLTSWRAS